jgi:hypothetical protein
MKRLTILALALFCIQARAACPANVPSGITTCYYIDYNSGSDSNDGASEASGHPWKNLPGMTGCASNCASNTPAAGYGYILKGGSVWPYTAFPLAWLWKGTSSGSSPGCTGSGCIYIGYDPMWNQGTVNSVIITKDYGGCPSSGVTASFSGGGGSNAAATVTTIGGQSNFNASGYMTQKAVVTNAGSGYTSDPAVTISGSGCNYVTAIADIQRPIFDLGAATACDNGGGGTPSYTWNETQMVTNGGIIQWGGQSASGGYLVVDHLDIRNAAFNTGAAGNSPLIEAIRESPNVIIENEYVHNWCTTQTHGTSGSDGSIAVNVGYNSTTASGVATGNIVDNGNAVYSCLTNALCGYGTAIQVQNGIGNATTFSNNTIAFSNWAARGCPGTISGNDIRATIESDNGGHTNNIYIGLCGSGAWTTIENNNLIHNTDIGANSQTQQGNGQSWYIINNVAWNATGSGTQWGVDTTTGAGATTSNMYWWDNTVVGDQGTGSCVNVNASGPDVSHLNVYLYNNHCISTQGANHWFVVNNGTIASVNGNASYSGTTADSANYLPTAISPYSETNALQPPNSSAGSVTFSGTNLTSSSPGCSTSGLTPLCSDLNSVARSGAGNWQAGAYWYQAPITGVGSSTGTYTMQGTYAIN